MFRLVHVLLVITWIILCQASIVLFGSRKNALSRSLTSLTSHFSQTHRDSKQVPGTLWNLLSIARYILCKFLVHRIVIHHMLYSLIHIEQNNSDIRPVSCFASLQYSFSAAMLLSRWHIFMWIWVFLLDAGEKTTWPLQRWCFVELLHTSQHTGFTCGDTGWTRYFFVIFRRRKCRSLIRLALTLTVNSALQHNDKSGPMATRAQMPSENNAICVQLKQQTKIIDRSIAQTSK